MVIHHQKMLLTISATVAAGATQAELAVPHDALQRLADAPTCALRCAAVVGSAASFGAVTVDAQPSTPHPLVPSGSTDPAQAHVLCTFTPLSTEGDAVKVGTGRDFRCTLRLNDAPAADAALLVTFAVE